MTVEPDTTRTEPLARLEEGPDAPTERARIEGRSPWALAWQRLRRGRTPPHSGVPRPPSLAEVGS